MGFLGADLMDQFPRAAACTSSVRRTPRWPYVLSGYTTWFAPQHPRSWVRLDTTYRQPAVLPMEQSLRESLALWTRTWGVSRPRKECWLWPTWKCQYYWARRGRLPPLMIELLSGLAMASAVVSPYCSRVRRHPSQGRTRTRQRWPRWPANVAQAFSTSLSQRSGLVPAG